MKKRLFPFFLALIMIFGIISMPSTALAAPSPAPLSISSAETLNAQFNTISDSTIFDESQSQTNLKTDASTTLLPIAKNQTPVVASFGRAVPLANAVLDLGEHPCGNASVTLGQDQIHIFLFTLTEATFIFSKMTSSNALYSYSIYTVEDNVLYSYSNSVLANGELNGSLPAGQYAFVVENRGGAYGDTYTLFMNTATPVPNDATSLTIISLSNSYLHVTVRFTTSAGKMIVYCDGARIFDETDSSLLDWERVYDLTWSSGYNYNKHAIYSAKISGVSPVGTYTSKYVSSENAVILYLDAGTGYMYNESRRNWNTGEHIFHFLDPFGVETPRTLTNYDIANYQCWLVFDLATGRPIDFWSWLNWYYATGAETASFSINAD